MRKNMRKSLVRVRITFFHHFFTNFRNFFTFVRDRFVSCRRPASKREGPPGLPLVLQAVEEVEVIIQMAQQ